MEDGQEKWKTLYEFDTPVVSNITIYQLERVPECHQIHIDKANAPETTPSSLKLMHRFQEEEVMQMMDAAEKS